MRPTPIHPTDRTLTIRIHHEANQIRPHIMSPEIIQRLAQVRLIQIDIHKHQAFEVVRRLRDECLTVRAVDPRVAVVDVVVLGVFARGRLEAHAFGGDGLERGEGVGACFDGVGGGYDVGVGVGDVGVGVRVFEGCGVGVEGPERTMISFDG